MAAAWFLNTSNDMKTHRILFAIPVLISGCITAMAIPRDIMVKHLGTEDGLSHQTANAIYQDEFGFIWIGTMDGLNRFDGHKTKVFKPGVGGGYGSDTTWLVDNNIRQICGDQNGHLYIKGLNSVSEFDMRSVTFRMLEDRDVRYIFHDGESLWIARTGSLCRMADGEFRTVFDFSGAGLDEAAIDCFIITRSGDMCVCTNTDGFYRINRNGHVIMHLESGAANSIFEDSKGNIWIASRNEGVYLVSKGGGISRYRHDPSDDASIPHDNVRQVCEDLDGNFWLGTYGGVCRYDPDEDCFVRYKYGFQHHAFNVRSIISMICDRQGTLWFGSFYEGVSYYNTEAETYFYYTPETEAEGKLNSPLSNSVSEDSDGNLWIGTEGGGLSRMDVVTRQFETMTVSDGLASDVIKTTLYDREENALYIATLRDGIDRYDIGIGTITNYGIGSRDCGFPNIENIVMMKPFGQDSIMLATNYGIFLFCKKTGEMSKLETGFDKNYQAQVWDMELDEDGNLWFTTSSDLYCYNIENRSTKYYPFHDFGSARANNNLNSILRDSRGRLWFGSSGSGVFRYDKADDSFRNAVPAEKMANGYVTGLAEDRRTGYIYIATNNGLARFCPGSGTVDVYNPANGFPLSSINDNSLFISSSGELFASDMNGLVSVQCDSLVGSPRNYNVYISGLLIDNRHISPDPSGKKAVLKEDILFQDRIILRPGHSAIGFDISNTDYGNNSSGLQVEYRMTGFDQEFIKASGTDHVTYTNLNPGNYTFIVKGLIPGPDGDFPSSRVAIKVIPPFYRTGWFILLCLAAVMIVSYYIIRTYITSIRLRSLLDLEKREKAYISQVNQEKLRLFTNISHEFRTPLTLIDGQLELILQRSDLKPSVYSRILSIYRNSRRLRRLVDEIVDIRKQDAGKMKLKVQEKDMMAFLREIYVSFEEYAQYRKIDFGFCGPDHPVVMLFDPVQMEKVFFNLLSNSFKFTREGGHIGMTVQETGDSVSVSVKDDGAGIDPANIAHVFERFFQDDKLNAKLSYQGSGVGLSLSKAIVEMHGGSISVTSEPEKETCFTVVLPMHPVFKAETVIVHEDSRDKTSELLREYTPDPVIAAGLPQENTQEKRDSEKTVKMLVVEDNDEVRDMLVQIFSPVYKVSSSRNGEEGIAMALADSPDIILSDVMMPGMSGFEMCRKLKNNMETSHIPIVLLTAKTAESQIVKGLQTGADDYVTKPFNVKILVARCNNLVEGRRRLQQKYLQQPEASVKMLTENPREQAMLENAVAVVMKHLDDPGFSIEVFAKEMGLSRTYLFTKIKGLTGQSPNGFISTIRLKQAVVRLKEQPDASMVDIAYSLGFSSPSYFIKCFKAMYGKTPNACRKELSGR